MSISVAICTYNGEKYLHEQINSILSQTVTPNEIVVCDDGSTDRTLEILAEHSNQNPGLFKIIRNETNLGYFKNFEKAIYSCSHDIIITSDQDDIWKPNKIELTKHFFSENPQFDAVFNDLEIINNDKIILEPSYLNWKRISYEFVEKNIEESTLFVQQQGLGSFVLGCALAIKKSALEKYQLKNFDIAHDYYISQKLSAKGKLGFIPQTLSQYRQHEEQVCGLREALEKAENSEEKKVELTKFQQIVWPYLSSVQKYQELYPNEDVKKSSIYAIFLAKRNEYLASLSFIERKKYILQCARHQYLDLQLKDVFKY